MIRRKAQEERELYDSMLNAQIKRSGKGTLAGDEIPKAYRKVYRLDDHYPVSGKPPVLEFYEAKVLKITRSFVYIELPVLREYVHRDAFPKHRLTRHSVMDRHRRYKNPAFSKAQAMANYREHIEWWRDQHKRGLANNRERLELLDAFEKKGAARARSKAQ